tara:strand:+ start:86030 stop:87697 length:1668 start_codon:yes stop_codon:yes gene_type:complete
MSCANGRIGTTANCNGPTVKKPETPKPDTSATPAKGQDRISIDSKGNANTSAAPAQNTSTGKDNPASAPGATKTASTSAPASGTNTTSTGKPASSTAKPAGAAPVGNGASGSTGAGGKNTGGTNNDAARPASGAKPGKPAIMVVIWAVIIVGIVLALAWASRALWWQQAQPTLSDLLPQTTMQALAPEAENTGNVAQNAAPATTMPQSTDNTAPAAPSGDDANSDSQASNSDGMGTMGMDTQQAAPSANATAAQAPDAGGASESTGTDDQPANNVVVATDLAARLSHLEGTIGALRERLDSERSGDLNASVARRLGELETRTAPIDDVARVQAELSGVAKEMRDLTARMATVEDELKATEGLRIAGRGQAIGIGVALLRDAAQRGGPFEVALSQLTRSGSDDAIVQKQIALLKPLASTGAPKIEQLRQSFSATAEEAIKSASDDNSGGIWDSTVANLKKLFPIRRIDVVGQETLDGRLVTAEQALAQDNLANAISALEGVSGQNAQTALAPWLAQARARQTINQAIDVLSSHAIGLLTGKEDKTGNTPQGSEEAQ